MGDIFERVAEADPEWWRVWVVEPLAPVGLIDASSGRLVPGGDAVDLQLLREQEAVLGRVTARLDRAWARYAATFPDIATTQSRVEELVVSRVKEATTTFFAAAREAVRAQIRAEYRWYTGIQDGTKVVAVRARGLGKAVGKWFNRVEDIIAGNMVESALRAVKRARRPRPAPAALKEGRPAIQLLERALERHANPALIEGALDQALQCAAAEVRALWAQTLELVLPRSATGPAPSRRQGSAAALGAAELDRSFGIMVSGTLAAVGASLALGAGWHTVGWGVVNLFPPALFAALLLSAVYAWAHKGRGRAELEEAADTIITALEQKVLADLEIHIRRDARENAYCTAENLRRVAFRYYTRCKYGERAFVALMRGLESRLDETTCQCHARMWREAAALHRHLEDCLAGVRARSDQGDFVAAAFLLGQAVELLLQLLAARFREPLAVHEREHMADLISRLRRERLVTAAQAEVLHRLRRQRNALFHDFEATAASHGLHFVEWLRAGAGEIDELLTAVSPVESAAAPA